MWTVTIVGLCLAGSLTSVASMSDNDIHSMELSTFYSDCEVFNDCKLFGGPVCGSDGKSYANCVHLSCLNHWRLPKEKVKMVCKGACDTAEPPFPWSPVYLPVCGSDNKTYANIEALMVHNEKADEETMVLHDGKCVDETASCLGVNTRNWEGAVCATNGRTYPSVEAIADMRRFGQCLDVLHAGGCTVDEVKERARTRTEICDLARNFYEYNPVCGDDDIIYANPYIMLCFRPNVKMQYMGECDSFLHEQCQAAVDIDKGDAESETEVCGSDGLTYTSIQHLECAKNVDKYVYFVHNGTCTAKDSPCVSMPELADQGHPVCGSDGVTYVNSHALWCMQRREDPFLMYFHDGPCFRRCLECSCGRGCGCNGGAPCGGGGEGTCPADKGSR